MHTVVPPYPGGIHLKTPQWIPETTESTKPYIYCFSYTYTPSHLKHFTASLWHVCSASITTLARWGHQ